MKKGISQNFLVTDLHDSVHSPSVAIHGRAYFNSKPVLCQVTSVLCLTTCICAFLNLGAITFNRYIRICRPGLKHLFTRCSCVATCIAVSRHTQHTERIFCRFLPGFDHLC